MSFSSLSALGSQAGAALGLPPLFTNWQSRLRPASFRGVPFFVDSHEENAGRRGILHEFPLRDTGLTEDLGRAIGRYAFEAYVVGDNYDQQRDALRQALYGVSGPGTLVHPWLGTLTVQVGERCSCRETRDRGGMAVFRLDFIEAGQPSYTRNDTAAGVLNAYAPLISALKLAFTAGALIMDNPGFILQALKAGLSSFMDGMLGLPAGTAAGIVSTIESIIATPADTTATPEAAAAAFAAVTAATLAAAPGPPDYSGGVAALATWSGAVFPNATLTPARQQQAANATALTALVQGLAVASVAQIYAQTNFRSAQDAQAARAQLLSLIDTQSLAAAAAGQGAVYAALQDLAAACSADLIQRAQALPTQVSYQVGPVLPALVLAYRFTGDITAAAALAALNGAPHPLFMPPSGIWLQAQA